MLHFEQKLLSAFSIVNQVFCLNPRIGNLSFDSRSRNMVSLGFSNQPHLIQDYHDYESQQSIDHYIIYF